MFDSKKPAKETAVNAQSYFVPKKSLKGYDTEHIDSSFNVPDVFMKNKFGSTAQYNYDIVEQNESEQDENTPLNATDSKKSKETIINVLHSN